MKMSLGGNSAFDSIVSTGLRLRLKQGDQSDIGMTSVRTFKPRKLSVAQAFDAKQLNRIVNDPDVKPWVSAPTEGQIDLSAAVANPKTVLLLADGGAFLFIQREFGVYEVCSQFLKSARGKKVLKAATDAMHWMFTRTDCFELYFRVPDGNLAAATLARSVKGEFLFHDVNGWPSLQGPVGVRWHCKSYQSWIRDADYLAETGAALSRASRVASPANASDILEKPRDETRDRYIGAACEMIASGQIYKGVEAYNRWARFTGRPAASIVSERPPVIDFNDAVVCATPNGLEARICQ